MDDANKVLTLQITLNEVNGVLTALGQLPFVQVNDLINKIRGQVGPQLVPQPAPVQEVAKSVNDPV